MYRKHDDGYQHRRHNKNLLMVHLIFVTKYRKPLLAGRLNDDVKQLVFEVCRRKHWYVRQMETNNDHIHILLQYNPQDNITGIVSVIKQYTTYHVWETWKHFLKKYYWKEHTFWSDGYFACSIGNASRETIENYIKNQG